jgi:hypothetical protein
VIAGERGENFGAGNVGRDRGRIETADVDQERSVAGATDRGRDEGVFRAFAVEGAEDGDGGPGAR